MTAVHTQIRSIMKVLLIQCVLALVPKIELPRVHLPRPRPGAQVGGVGPLDFFF